MHKNSLFCVRQDTLEINWGRWRPLPNCPYECWWQRGCGRGGWHSPGEWGDPRVTRTQTRWRSSEFTATWSETRMPRGKRVFIFQSITKENEENVELSREALFKSILASHNLVWPQPSPQGKLSSHHCSKPIHYFLFWPVTLVST